MAVYRFNYNSKLSP